MRGASVALVPEVVPVLSRGKHRNSRKGACFMEMASYLAGERWSDHPGCTHPLVATVARLVNDYTTDEHRSPPGRVDPVGHRADDHRPAPTPVIALRCATAALPIASAKRQNVMAVSVLVAERTLAALDGREPGDLQASSLVALDRAPHAADWARGVRGQVRHVGRRVPSVRRSAHRRAWPSRRSPRRVYPIPTSGCTTCSPSSSMSARRCAQLSQARRSHPATRPRASSNPCTDEPRRAGTDHPRSCVTRVIVRASPSGLWSPCGSSSRPLPLRRGRAGGCASATTGYVNPRTGLEFAVVVRPPANPSPAHKGAQRPSDTRRPALNGS